MLSGEYEHTLDAKGRVILPMQLRAELGDKFYVTRGFEKCLAIYSVEGFEKLGETIDALPNSSREVRRIERMLIPSARLCEVDKQGRFVVPQRLREFANIEKDVMIVGSGRRAEIWNPELWEDYLYGEDSMELEDAADILREQGLSL